MLQRFLGRLGVGIHFTGFPSSPQAYAETEKIKILSACIRNMSLFLIQLEAEAIENPPYPFQYPVAVASA
jgi:hypothetical protein